MIKKKLTTEDIRKLFMQDYLKKRDIVKSEIFNVLLVQQEFNLTDEQILDMPSARFDVYQEWVVEKYRKFNGGKKTSFVPLR